MRTNIVLDDDLVAEAQRLTGIGTKREVVNYALRELVARQKRLGISSLRGIGWDGDLDELRPGRHG